MIDEGAIQLRYAALDPVLDERGRRGLPRRRGRHIEQKGLGRERYLYFLKADLKALLKQL